MGRSAFCKCENKAQISCSATAQLISAFVFCYIDSTLALQFKHLAISCVQPTLSMTLPEIYMTGFVIMSINLEF